MMIPTTIHVLPDVSAPYFQCAVAKSYHFRSICQIIQTGFGVLQKYRPSP